MLEYPPPIRLAHFHDPAYQGLDDQQEDHVSRRSHDSDLVNVIGHSPCGVLELKVDAPGKKIKQSFISSTPHGVILPADKNSRLAFAPSLESLTIRWKLRGAPSVDSLTLEIFRRSAAAEAAVWTKTINRPNGGFAREGSLNFNGDLGTGDAACPFPLDFPDNYLTVEHAPYKLKITAEPVNGAVPNDPPERWVYLDVLVDAIELEWGDSQVLSDRTDVPTTFQWTPKGGAAITETLAPWVLQKEQGLLQELRTKPPSKNRDVEIPCDAHGFCTDTTQWSDDNLYRSYRDLWKEGPRIPLWAKVLVRNSKGKGVLDPLALGNAKFLWDWEDRGNKIATWCKPAPKPVSRTFLEDSLSYLVTEEWQQLRQAEGSDNCHRKRGGKRGENGSPVFPPQNPVNYARNEAALRVKEFPFKVDPEATRLWGAVSTARTRGVLAGRTGVLFQPSRMAGDSYKISVYFLWSDTPNLEDFPLDEDADTTRQQVQVPYVSSGWFTMWRKVTVHVLRKAKAPLAKAPVVNKIYAEAGIRLEFRPKVAINIGQWQTAVNAALDELRGDHTARLLVSEWSILLPPAQSATDANAITMVTPAEMTQRVQHLEGQGINKVYTTFAAGDVAAGDRFSAAGGTKRGNVIGIGADALRPGPLGIIVALDTGHADLALGDTVNIARTGANFTIANANDLQVVPNAQKPSLLSDKFRAADFPNKWVNPSQSLIQLAGRYYIDALYPNERGIFLFQFRSHYKGERPGAPAEGWAKASVSTRARALVFGTSNSDWQGFNTPTNFPGRPNTTSSKAHRNRDEVIAHEMGHSFFLPHTSGGNIGDAINGLHVKIETNPTGGAIDERDHCLMNYHPYARRFCGFCILRLRGWSAFGVADLVNADNTLPMVNESFRNRADGTPTITPERPVVIRQKHLATNLVQRTKVEIRITKPFAGTATLTSTGTNIVFSTNPDGTGPLTVHQGGGQTFPAAQINDFHTIWAEATGPGPVTLTLDDGAGHTATADLLGVELTLELHTARIGATAPVAMTDPARRTQGRYIHVQDAQNSHARAKIVIQPPNPNTFTGNLKLAGSRVRLFSNEAPTPGETALPDTFPAPNAPQEFWIEGTQASPAVLQHLELSADGIPGVADWVSVTVVQLSWKATVPATPEKTARPLQQPGDPANTPVRLEITSSCASLDLNRNIPLTLLKGTADAATGVALTEPPDVEATVLPAGLPVHWARIQMQGDNGVLPTLTPDAANALKASFTTNGVGAFHLRAYVDTNNNNTYDVSKPSAVMNVVLVEVTLLADQTVVSSANCVARHDPGTGEIQLFSGPFDFAGAAMKFKGRVKLTGGGPDRKAGLKQVFGGWVNNIVGDDTGAVYEKAPGQTIEARALYMHDRNLLNSRIDPQPASPLLDTGRNSAHTGGLFTTLSQQLPALAAGGVEPHVQALGNDWEITFDSIDAPGTGFDLLHKIDRNPPNQYKIKRVWMDTRFRAYLCLWTDMGEGRASDVKPARHLFGVLLEIPWRMRGAYNVNTAAPAPVITATQALTVTKSASTTFNPMRTASATNIEVRPPNPHSRAVDFNPPNTITRVWPD